MSARVCWLAEIEFETGVRNGYKNTPEEVRAWLQRALETSGTLTLGPSSVRVVSLIMPKMKPTPPAAPGVIKKRKVSKKKRCPQHSKFPLSAGGECSICGNYY